MKWNLIFSSITALSALVGSGAIILAVRQFKFSTWLKAQEIFVDSDFREARGVVLPHYWQKDKVWTDDEKKKRELVCARMDELARLVPYIKENQFSRLGAIQWESVGMSSKISPDKS